MEYKKSMIILILTIFLVSIASVCASDANDTAIASEDTIPIAQSDEISVNDDNQAIGQANEEEIISEGNVATFSELQRNITETSSGTLELDRNYEYDEGFDTSGIKIDNSITIDGKGYTIDAKGKARVFNIQASDVTIKNLIIKNASYGGDGGAIYFSQSGTVTNCNFTGNTASGDGGAIWMYSGSVENCNFTNNQATESYPKGNGGAIYFGSKGNVTNCNFTNNEANGPRSSGGAMYFLNGGDITNCNFAYNTAKYEGGAVSFYNTSTVTNCSFINNELPNCDGSGGAIYLRDGSIKNCKFINNSVSDNEPYISYSGSGGAIWTFFANIENCNFTNNTATGGCGAIDSNYGGYVTNCNFINNKAINGDSSTGALFLARGNVTNCNFINNSAGYSAGAINTNYDLHVINCNFTNNKVTGDASMAGAISMGEGSIENCNFINNSAADDAGAIYAAKSRVENCNFINNHVSRNMSRGGAISMLFSNVTNCNFTNNTANGDGGAIHADEGSIENCSFSNNRVTDDNSFGGAVYLEKSNVINCSFTNNTACDGGAVYLNGGNVANCSFTNNKVIAHYVYSVSLGGAIYFTSSGSTVTNCNFTDNSASYGGAIYFNNDGTVENCNFIDNNATYQGGAIQFSSTGTVTNCNFIDNNATYQGGAIQFSSTGTVTNCNFVKNSAKNGVHIYSMNCYTTADTCIFKTDPDLNFNVVNLPPTLNVDNFTTVYNSGEKLTFDLKTNEGTPVYNGNISISVYYKNNNSWFVNCSCLSGEGWNVDLPVGLYYAVFNTEYAEFKPINRTITIIPDTSFGALNHAINAHDTSEVNLTNDYCYDPDFDGEFADGIVINRPVTINGNGHTINAQAKARVFNVAASGVTINNLTIKNANHTGNGGAIYFSQSGSVTNCNFTNNQATGSNPNGNGGAVYFDKDGDVTNCNFDDNTASYAGGALYFFYENSYGEVINCNFTNNKATGEFGAGGAIRMQCGGVDNCNFTNNTAIFSGAILFGNNANVTNCNFTNNNASHYGGAVSFQGGGDVINCNFTNNKATGEFGAGGAVYFANSDSTYTVTNCNFTGNRATTGSAICFVDDSSIKIISDSCFLNNKAKVDENAPLNVTINENNITITFMGQNNLLNAIYSIDDAEVTFTNVTYWGANGITNTGSSTITPSRSNREAGQNITVGIVVNDELVLNEVKVTDENGTIVLDISVGDNYYILVRHDEDSYYTEAEKAISNMKFYVNVTETETTNKTVNITAKSNIYNEVMPGKLLFILPNGDVINATYAVDGIWWAVHTFEDYAFYQLNASYIGLDNLTVSNATINITRANSTVEVGDAVLNYGEVKNVVVTAQGATGITATIDNTPVKVINNYTIVISGLDVGTHTLTVTTIADEDHNPVTRNATITVNKAKTELTAKAVKTTYNVNKNLVITLKDSTGKALSGVKVSVNLKGTKTYTTDKNGQIKINVAKLVPKTYTAKVTFEGNANYLKSTADVKVTVKKAKPKITAKKKTYKLKSKNKKFTITLKDNKGKAIKKAKVTVKVIKIKKNSKKKKSKKSGMKNILKAKTNKKGKATFKINRNSKGKYQVIIKYKGNKYYKSATKKVKIKIK